MRYIFAILFFCMLSLSFGSYTNDTNPIDQDKIEQVYKEFQPENDFILYQNVTFYVQKRLEFENYGYGWVNSNSNRFINYRFFPDKRLKSTGLIIRCRSAFI